MIENSPESPPISANKRPDFAEQSAAKKMFSANKDSFTSKFNSTCKLPHFWSHDADSWLRFT